MFCEVCMECLIADLIGSECVVVFTKPGCKYCTMLKDDLVKNNIVFKEVDITQYDDVFKEMLCTLSGSRTMPQMFCGKQFMGGYSEFITHFSSKNFHYICKSKCGIEVPEPDF